MKHTFWLGGILLLYLLLAFTYSIVVPLAETPDESEHFRYLFYIEQTGTLPVMQPEREANVTLEAHQPPLLYLVGAGLTSWIEMDEADLLLENHCFSFEPDDLGRQHAFWHQSAEWPPRRGVFLAFQLMRWLSVLLGAGAIGVTYRIGRLAVPTQPMIGVGAAALLGFNPQFVLMMGSFNNDVPTVLLGCLIVWGGITAVSRNRYRDYLLVGIWVGLGLLTKFALLALWPLALLAAVWPLWSWRSRLLNRGVPNGKEVRGSSFSLRMAIGRVGVNSAIVLGVPLLIAGWWYWRAYQLHGDPFMWEVTLAAKGSVIARQGMFTLADLGEFIVFHFQSYWLWFGWLNVKPPAWVYVGFLGVCLTAVWGWLLWVKRRNVSVDGFVLLLCGLAVLGIYASLFRYIQTINWTGYQGRLAYAAAGPIAVLLAIGLWQVGGRRLVGGVGIGFLGLTMVALPWLVLPAYPRPAIYQPDGLAAGALTAVCGRFESGWQLEAVDVPDVVPLGDELRVTLHGYGLRDGVTPERVAVQLWGREGAVIGQGETMMTWQAQQVVSQTVWVPVATDALPVLGTVAVGMQNEAGGWQAATSATERVLMPPLLVAQVKVMPKRPFVPMPQQATEVSFGNGLRLIGYDQVIDGEHLILTLYWQAERVMGRDFTTFVHLLDSEGNLQAQSDGQPQNGAYPTSIWFVDEVVADTKIVFLPEGVEVVDMAVGVYHLESGERLTVTDAIGTVLSHDRFLLP